MKKRCQAGLVRNSQGWGFSVLGKKLEPQFAVDLLALYDGKLGIEKEVEFVYPGLEELGECEVSQLMDKDQEGEGQDYLDYLYEDC